MDGDIKELLRERAEDLAIDPRIPDGVLRRSRRRRVGTSVLAGVVLAGVAFGAYAGGRAILSEVPGPAPGEEIGVGAPGLSARAIFPSTPEEIQNTQESVSEGHQPLWLSPEGVAEMYAVNVLGWELADVESSVGGDAPVSVVIENSTLAETTAGTGLRTTLTMESLAGEPGPDDDIYLVTAAETEIITLESPAPGQRVQPGSTVVFEGTLHLAPGSATVESGLTWEGDGGAAGTAAAPGKPDFQAQIKVPEYVTDDPIVSVTVHDASGPALGITSFRLFNGGGTPIDGEVVVPAAVEATRLAILDAARSRDWEALRSLIPEDGFTFSFGIERDPIRFWKQLEADGEPVLDILVDVLETAPFASNQYFWPAAAAKVPSEWTPEDISDLRTMATPRDIRQWQEADLYYGWRVGIARDGTWVFFVAGD